MPDTFSKDVRVFYPKYRKEELVEKLKKIFKAISEKIKIEEAALFGSYAKEKNTAFSDIDIFVVVANNYGMDAYSICWDMIGIPEVELHVYSLDEFQAMKKAENSFLREVERDGIDLMVP